MSNYFSIIKNMQQATDKKRNWQSVSADYTRVMTNVHGIHTP